MPQRGEHVFEIDYRRLRKLPVSVATQSQPGQIISASVQHPGQLGNVDVHFFIYPEVVESDECVNKRL